VDFCGKRFPSEAVHYGQRLDLPYASGSVKLKHHSRSPCSTSRSAPPEWVIGVRSTVTRLRLPRHALSPSSR
jgi:hypothetical protein